MARARLFTLFSLSLIGICCSLGTWQLARKTEKEKLIARLELTQRASPQNVDTLKTLVFPQKLFATGQFLPSKVRFLSAKTYQEKIGFYLLQVFQTQGGRFLLVQRGWTPHPLIPHDQHPQTIEGIARLPSPPTYFQPQNVPPTYFWIDLPQVSQDLGIPLLPYYMVASTSSHPDILVTKAFPSLPNNHLSYAITWYSLALFLMGMLLYKKKYFSSKEYK